MTRVVAATALVCLLASELFISRLSALPSRLPPPGAEAFRAKAALASRLAQRADVQRAPTPTVTFQNIAPAAGLDFVHVNGASAEKYLVETMGSGGLFFDYDHDGWLDIFLVDGGSLADRQIAGRARHRLYRNRGDGTFADVTRASGIDQRPSAGLGAGDYGMGACAGDIDNDGHVDLYVTSFGPNVLYRNTGKGAFRDATRAAGVGPLPPKASARAAEARSAREGAAPLWSTSCAFLDFDTDGRLDLFVTNYVDTGMGNNKFCGDAGRNLRSYCHPLNYGGLANALYRNNGDGTFTDVSAGVGIAKHRGNGLGVVVGDYDDDGWPDIFVANDSVPNFLFHNEGGKSFAETALLAGVAVALEGKPRAGMGTDFGDLDGDGLLDLIVTNHEFETTSLFRNLGRGLFADATAESGLGPATLPFVGFGVVLLDYDNDTHLDVAMVNGHVIDNTASFRSGSTHAQRKLLFHNNGGRRLTEVGRQSGAGFAEDRVGRTLAAGDVDNDGDLDFLVTNNGQQVELLRNDGGNRNRSLAIQLVGRRANRQGIGARLRATTGSTTQMRDVKAGSSYLGQNDVRVHFGLGQREAVDRLEIRWPSGRTEVVERLAGNAMVTIVEGEGVKRSEKLKGESRK